MTKPTGRPVGRPPKPKPKNPPPKRPRGRPKGSKNKPKDLASFIERAFTEPLKPTVERKKPNQNLNRQKDWTPEQRAAWSKRLNARQDFKNRNGTGNPGKPNHLTQAEWKSIVDQAKPEAKRIIKVMQKNGTLPDLDPRAEEAMAALLVMLKSQASTRDKTTIAKTILDFTMSKPSSKTEVTVKTAEEMLDDLADVVLEGEDPEDEDDGDEEDEQHPLD